MRYKIALAAVGVIAVAGAGVLTAALLANLQPHTENEPKTQAETETAVTTAVPSTAQPTTVQPTEAPTEPDYTEAYRAYLDVLAENESAIKEYDWQYKDDPSHPVVFANVIGDDTPEMIYAYAVKTNNANSLFVRIATFDGSKAKTAYEYNGIGSGGFFAFQSEGEKNLYLYAKPAPAYPAIQKVLRLNEKGDKLDEMVSYNHIDGYTPLYPSINGERASEEDAQDELDRLISNASVLLMSSSDNNGNSYPRALGLDAERYPNQSKTYDEAVSYLKKLIGDDSPLESQQADFSIIAGKYSFMKEFGPTESEIKIKSDGNFVRESYCFTGTPMYDSICTGRVTGLKQDGSVKTKYTFYMTDQKLEHSSGTTGSRTQNGHTITFSYTDSAMFKSEEPLAVYLSGTAVSDLSEDAYDSFKRFEKSEAADGYLHYNLLVVPGEKYSSIFKMN